MSDATIWIAWAAVAMGYLIALVILVGIQNDRHHDLSKRIAALDAKVASRSSVTPWAEIKAGQPDTPERRAAYWSGVAETLAETLADADRRYE